MIALLAWALCHLTGLQYNDRCVLQPGTHKGFEARMHQAEEARQ